MSQNKPLVSVLMLTYNHAPYISQAIESVLGQETSYDFELIICDDASTDGTTEIAKKYAAQDERIILSLQPSNTKFGKNFVDGCEKIRGKYVAFCEGDDYWTSTDKLQKQVAFLEANPDFAVSAHKVQMLQMDSHQPDTRTQYIYKDCTADEQRIRDGVFYADEAIDNYYFQTGSLVLRWRFHDGLPHWFRQRMMFDHFMFMLHAVEGKIKYFDEAMSVWRRHGGGYTWLQTQDKGLFFQKEGADWIKMYQNMDEFFSGRFKLQIRERILLALRSMASNCITTGNIDHLRSLVTANKRYFDDVLKDAILVDAIRMAFPEAPEFAPPWQSTPTLPSQSAVCPDPSEQPDSACGGIFALAVADIPSCRESVWNSWTSGHEFACFFNLRSALMRWLWQNGVSTVWFPAYLPPMLDSNRFTCQFNRKFYRISSTLEPSLDFLEEVQPGECVLTINYLGRPVSEEFSAALGLRKDIFWIEDLAQSMDAVGKTRSNAAIYSPRKLFGVPDGGILVGSGADSLAGWLEDSSIDVTRQRIAMMIDRYEGECGAASGSLAWLKNDWEHQMSRHRMSKITKDILQRIPAQPVSEKRRDNWAVLYELLEEYCLWPIGRPSFTPYAFPFLAPRDFPLEIIHTQLARANIISERMWFPLPVASNLFPIEESISRRLLLLPCDQRHGKEDMERIASKVLSILESGM